MTLPCFRSTSFLFESAEDDDDADVRCMLFCDRNRAVTNKLIYSTLQLVGVSEILTVLHERAFPTSFFSKLHRARMFGKLLPLSKLIFLKCNNSFSTL